MRKIKSLILYIFALAPFAAFAQKDVPSQSQDVIKNFDAKLLETERINVNPVLPAVDTATKAQAYTIPNKVLNVDYTAPRMRPVAIKTEKLPPQYKGYAKAGYGLPNSPYLEGAYRFGDPRKYLVGLKLKHHSADNGKALENQRFSTTNGELNGTFYAQAGLAVDAKIGYDNNTRQFYGYNHDKFSYAREDTKQKFNTLSAGAKVYNSARTVADFNYALGLNFYNMNDNFSNKETDFNIRAEATKWFSEKHPLSIVLRTEFTTLSPKSDKTQNLNNIILNPSFTFKGDAFSIRAGANLVSHKDVFYPLPDIEANANIAGNIIQAFAGWKGDFVKNSYRNLSNYNPFIAPDSFAIKNTVKTEYYGGVKGSISLFDYSAQVGFSDNKNLALFLPDTTDKYRRFDVLYDTVKIFNIRGAITMHPIKNMELVATASQNIYTANNQKAAWGLPSTDINVAAKYTVVSKGDQTALAKASLFVQNGVPVKTKTGDIQRLNPLFDINIGGEYWFSKNIGAFLDINNLLNLKRERWQNYPNLGMNILGGFTARF
ncbi:MAG: hypothetical protein JNL70_10610 [Saprospiraceae bacterium]|nr:hypothetical protein [Saprospiraceae bacterium]